MNVIDNALKYNRPHGSVFVRVRETGFRDGTADFRFVIEDTGIGIGEDFKKHIFEPFTQENQVARTDYAGIGLGMSIVKKLAEQMEGTVEVESRIGEGSVIYITVPIRVDGEKMLIRQRRSWTCRAILPECAFSWWMTMRSTERF